MIEFQALGAAQTVTGSKHLLRTSQATVLLDCGLFQGRRAEAAAKNRALAVDVSVLDAVVLSHAHIDHSGALPLLVRQGYTGPVFATMATKDLCQPMLLDTAMIQEADARHIDRLIARGVPGLTAVEPLYGEADVRALLGQLVGVSYRKRQPVAPGISVTFLDAGHVLGSALAVLDIEDEGQIMRVCFTGDLGRHHLPILRDPEIPDGVGCLIMESTYGDRLHEPIENMGDKLAAVVNRTVARGGKIVIPSFALERAQEVVYELKVLIQTGRIAPLPVYVDSPLTVKLTEVFAVHPECFDARARLLLHRQDSPFQFLGLQYVSDVEDSKCIDEETRPSIIISASGMCEAGRVLHHLRATISEAKNTVLIVGFQAPYTLGRRLVEGQAKVRIFGMMHDRRAEVVVLDGFSAHADQLGLLEFAEDVRRRGPLRQVILVHGEPDAQRALRACLGARGFPDVTAPSPGQRLRL